MNTFLPYNDFKKVAQCLDRQRLNKQILEGTQIIDVILKKNNLIDNPNGKQGWWSHPVYKLWTDNRGQIFVYQLIDYIDILYKEWIDRGYKNTTWLPKKENYLKLIRENEHLFGNKDIELFWSKEFQEIMRANLIRKDKDYYQKFFGDIKEQEGYIWENCKIKSII